MATSLAVVVRRQPVTAAVPASGPRAGARVAPPAMPAPRGPCCACGGGCPRCQREGAAAGQPLDPATRALMERRLGADFSRVRIHTDAAAAASARALGARAYTAGDDIAFARGAYRPETREGRGLLAHELTHVAQQRGPSRGRVQLARDPGSSVCAASDLSALDVGTHAHIQIQQQFLDWCRATRSGIADCATENRLPLGSVKGETGRPDMMRRTTGTSRGTVWEVGEIKPVSWWIRGDDDRAIAQLQNYIAAIRTRGEEAVPLQLFLPSTPVGPFRGNAVVDLYATPGGQGIYYYWCEKRDSDDRRNKDPKALPVELPAPVVIDLAPEFERWRPLIEPELDHKIAPDRPGPGWYIVAPLVVVEMVVGELLKKFGGALDPRATPVSGFRHLIEHLALVEAVTSGTILTITAGGLLALSGATAAGGVTAAGGGTVVGGGATKGAEVISLAAVRAAARSAAARELAKAAAVLLVVCVARESHGETTISEVHAVQAVPVGSLEVADGGALGQRVTYAGEAHVVIGRVAPRGGAAPRR